MVSLKDEVLQGLHVAFSILVPILRHNTLNKNWTFNQNYHHKEFHRIATDVANPVSHPS